MYCFTSTFNIIMKNYYLELILFYFQSAVQIHLAVIVWVASICQLKAMGKKLINIKPKINTKIKEIESNLSSLI